MTPHIEILHVRDPDGPCTVSVWVDGEPADHVSEVTVDAGAGHDCHDWEEDRASTVPSSEAFRAAAEEAYDDPPGSEYITHIGCDHKR